MTVLDRMKVAGFHQANAFRAGSSTKLERPALKALAQVFNPCGVRPEWSGAGVLEPPSLVPCEPVAEAETATPTTCAPGSDAPFRLALR